MAHGAARLLVESGLITGRLPAGESERPAPSRPRRFTAERVTHPCARGQLAVDAPVAAGFQVGQQVQARNIHPVGATRLPRYVRGKLGTVDRDHGVFVFPGHERPVPW